MATINTNMAANIASNSMTRNERSMSSTMERLSTGLRINSAKDDAAGLAISSKMTSQIRGLNQAVRNANDAISMIQVAEGAMKEVTNMFQRMRELAVQSISDSNTANDRTALNNEFVQLNAEIQRVAGNTQWNGTNILDGDSTSTTFQVGANASQTIDVDFGTLGANITSSVTYAQAATGATAVVDFTGTFKDGDQIVFKTEAGNTIKIDVNSTLAGHLNSTNSSGTGTAAAVTGYTLAASTSAGNVETSVAVANNGNLTITGATESGTASFTISDVSVGRGTQEAVNTADITDSTKAASALGTLDDAIKAVNSTRAGLGASMSRLEYASDNLQNVAQNTSSARSRVLDADYAAETTELARTQIIQQAATAMLAQANQSQQAVLSLLR
ncbi:MAG: flagellin [Porticoccaceae bacterium]|nr:flagellin [Porticoccaceae bacterium]